MQLIFNSPLQTGGSTYTGNDGVSNPLQGLNLSIPDSANTQARMINNQAGLPITSYQHITIAPIYYIIGAIIILWVVFR